MNKISSNTAKQEFSPHEKTAGFEKNHLLAKVYNNAAKKMINIVCDNLLADLDGEILELLSGSYSLLPESLRDKKIIGISACAEDLEQNKQLESYRLLNLNHNPGLPFKEDRFDAALLLFGLETLDYPQAVFAEVARTLKPGGVFIVAYSSATIAEFADSGWMNLNDKEKLAVIDDCFECTDIFGPVKSYRTKKRYRSEASKKKYPAKNQAPFGLVYSYKRVLDDKRDIAWGSLPKIKEAEATKDHCPYCGESLKKWEVPHSPFEIDCWYDADFLNICFNDECPYFQRGWEWMWTTLRRNVSYRYMCHPVSGKSGPMPVPTDFALKDGIIEEPGDKV